MPRVRAPHQVVAMLCPVNPIQNKIHDKERDNDFENARQILQIMHGPREEGWGDIADDAADEPGGNAIYGERKSEGQRIQFEIEPAINGPRGPDAFTHLEDEYQPEKCGNLIIVCS